MIKRILVANRGEIARRIFTTARRVGIETVAVHSDADVDLPFVREADAAVRLPGNTPAETYLRADLVLEAARRTGADAIHPGYGFLSENADFARKVIGAGLTWIGPAPESIVSMGSKIESKKLMAAAGVPVLPDLTVDTATEDDLPLLVKASAGGGGRGMRIVRTLADLPREIAAAQAEAEAAFGDGTVFVEPYVEHSRHVEVQVVGDRFGEVAVLGERDCSVQRRHQKVIEEAPAPNIDPTVVAQMHEAARNAGSAIDYLGAGTVEFLYDPDKERFFFLEMNTRLQVEHPVTEAVFDVDLVELQLAVAEGRSLAGLDTPRSSLAGHSTSEAGTAGHSTSEPGTAGHSTSEATFGGRVGAEGRGDVSRPAGHAIEVRLYAEDPAHDWQPQSGRLTSFEIPGLTEFERAGRAGVRVDSGFESGSEVSTHYDAMLAKVIAWAPTRAETARMLAGALRRARLHGIVTNRDMLVAALMNESFLSGEVSTAFFDREPAVLDAGTGDPDPTTLFAAAVLRAEQVAARRKVQTRIPVGWRNVVSQPQRTTFSVGETEHVVEWTTGRSGYEAASSDTGIEVLEASPHAVHLRVNGISTRFDGVVTDDHVHVDGPLGAVSLRVVPRFVDPADQVAEGSLLAPMPGTIISVGASVGDQVDEGQTILVMEAMKMQHTIAAPYAGTVTELPATAGQQVEAGAVLAVVSTDQSTDSEGEPA
ncbi:ATP-grasp domain-containing protein [Nocardioides sp. JQ2195]|uniref:acetyl/propionyl/methylcrotonyl-CoA carboxylase subunit alpha n=1 Tax=Nocardioides sp. JQ2195 TaxID=2592334 RepID=UPI00143E9BDE|nr:biotin carboxylase N-terminal domain-containing protein [Nocardioides sp. JQ2195]QIX28322.1 ATP-grasp domain-containing protein [Nocardioides sp. JQ2195]